MILDCVKVDFGIIEVGKTKQITLKVINKNPIKTIQNDSLSHHSLETSTLKRLGLNIILIIYFNNPIEYEAINNVLNWNCVHHMAWWVGYNEDDYEVTTENGRNINDGLLNWFGSLNWANTNPETPDSNDKLG